MAGVQKEISRHDTYIGLVWNESQKDKLEVTWRTLQNLGISPEKVLVFDDSLVEDYSLLFQSKGHTVFYEKLDREKYKTIEERITYGRNRIRDEFLKTKGTHIFWLDGDVLCPPQTIERLVSYGLDNITAVRPQQGGIPGVFPFRGDLPKDVYVTKGLPNFQTVNWEWLCPLRVAEISCYGFGCNLVSREATERCEFWVKPYTPATHDILYSMDLQKLGYLTFVDTGLLCKTLL